MSKLNKADVELHKVGLTADDMVLEEFDAAEFLTDKETIAAYFTAALKSGDTEYLKEAVKTVARAEESIGMAEIAAHAGITREGAYKSLRKGTDPKMSTIMGILDALGLEFQVIPKHASDDNSYALAA